MKKAIGYCRKSTDRQEQSIEQQKQAINLYAKKNDYEIVKWYSDEGISGSRFKDRPALRNMISACNTEKGFEAILVYDKSRFGRPQDTRELAHYEWLITETGKRLIYTNSNFKDDGSIASAIMGVVETHQAGQYLTDLSRVVSRAFVSNAMKGILNGRRAPYGYNHLVCSAEGVKKYIVKMFPEKYIKIRYDYKTRKEIDCISVSRPIPKEDTDYLTLIPDPEKAKAIKNIFKWYSEGYGGRQIADKLNVMKVCAPMKPTKLHKKGDRFWSCSTIRDILLNPAYTGDTVHNRTTSSKYHSIEPDGDVTQKSKEARNFQKNPKSKWIIVKNTHEPVISRKLFVTCERIRQDRAKAYNRFTYTRKGTKYQFLLTGILKDRDCGYNFTGSEYIKQGRRFPCYVDGGYKKKGKNFCSKKTIERDMIEAFILGRIKKRVNTLLGTDGLKKIMRVMLKDVLKNGNGYSVKNIKDRLVEIDGQVDNLLDNINPKFQDVFNAKLEKLSAEKEELQAKMKELEAKKTIKLDVEKVVDRAISYLRNFDKISLKVDYTKRKILVSQFIEKIETIGEAEMDITYYNIPRYDITAPLFSLCCDSMERVRGIEPP